MRRSAKGSCGDPQRVDPLRSDTKGWNKRVSSFVVVVAETARDGKIYFKCRYRNLSLVTIKCIKKILIQFKIKQICFWRFYGRLRSHSTVRPSSSSHLTYILSPSHRKGV